jgi:hypothetical protein
VTQVEATTTEELLAEALLRVDAVPEYDVFPTVDEMWAGIERLATEHPGVAQLRRVGSSRLGEPLLCLTVGEGSRNVLVVGMPHPNEPIGALTAQHLAETLCTDESFRDGFDYTWHIVPCIDPDGTRLNEGWFRGPFSRTHYARHFYRPAPNDQVEWTFPFQYKRAYFDAVLPETLALMRLIDDLEPTLLVSLHNAESGGVYYYISRPAPALHGVLKAVPAHLGLALDTGEPEASWAPVYDTAIFGELTSEAGYDHLEEAGQDPAKRTGGASSSAYASRHGTFTLVAELPYWSDERSDDSGTSEEQYSAVLRTQADGLAEVATAMTEALERVGGELVETPFLRAATAFAALMSDHADMSRWRADNLEEDRAATVAEVVSNRDLVHMFRLRFVGILLRALDAQIDAGLASPAVRETRQALGERFDAWCVEAEAETPAQALPIRKLVATQLGALVATARYLERS